MQLAYSPAPTTSMLLLTFLGGLTLVALVFWSVLHRVKRGDGSDRGAARSGGAGKHALNRRRVSQPTRVTNTAPKHAATAAHTTLRTAEPAETTAEQSQAVAARAHPPAQHSEEPADIQRPPSDLFRQHHAEHFRRAHQRLDSIRAQLAEL